METLACLRASRGHRLLLSSGNGTTLDMIPENMRMMIQTALSGVCGPKKAVPLEIKGTIAYFLNHFMPFCPL